MIILAVVTGVAHYRDHALPTGLWLSELTHLYHAARGRGYQVVVASPKGGATPVDPESLKPLFIDRLSRDLRADAEFDSRLSSTLRLSEVAGDLFDCVYLAGGHGTMFDFPDNPTLPSLLQKHVERGRLVAAICHGVAGLLAAKDTTNLPLVRGKTITGFSWFEEVLARRSSSVPFNLEAQLKERGARYEKAFLPFTSKVCVDGHLITGQNPFSSRATAARIMDALARR